MVKKSSGLEEATKLLQEISQKLELKTAVSLELIEDVGILEQVPEETKKLGIFLIVQRLQENFAPIFILDSFFKNKRFWGRMLAHECGHIKTFYNGLPYFYLKSVDEESSPIINKVQVMLDEFPSYFDKYRNLDDFYEVARQFLFSDIRERIHDHLANIEAINATFIDDYVIFAEFELKKFSNLRFLDRPYVSKLIVMDLSEKLVTLQSTHTTKCHQTIRKYDSFFESLSKFNLAEYVTDCKKFFWRLEFTTDSDHMRSNYMDGLKILIGNVSSSELAESIHRALEKIALLSMDSAVFF